MILSKVSNKEALAFLNSFLLHRNINRKYFNLVPEDKYDYRMVDTYERKSDSPRESLVHQINVENSYLLGIETGTLKFGSTYDKGLIIKGKSELLNLLEQADAHLVDLLSTDANINKIVIVPWGKSGIRAIDMLWSMNSHEILHTGWNLAVMDHLNIERFPKLKRIWG